MKADKEVENVKIKVEEITPLQAIEAGKQMAEHEHRAGYSFRANLLVPADTSPCKPAEELGAKNIR